MHSYVTILFYRKILRQLFFFLADNEMRTKSRAVSRKEKYYGKSSCFSEGLLLAPLDHKQPTVDCDEVINDWQTKELPKTMEEFKCVVKKTTLRSGHQKFVATCKGTLKELEEGKGTK